MGNVDNKGLCREEQNEFSKLPPVGLEPGTPYDPCVFRVWYCERMTFSVTAGRVSLLGFDCVARTQRTGTTVASIKSSTAFCK